jgi:hypothetical protein
MYKTSPSIMKLLYDKYYRNELFNKITKSSYIEPGSIIYSNFENTKINNDIIFEELVALKYYTTIFEYKMKIALSISFSVLNYIIYRMIKVNNMQSKEFVFVDNNRMIYNTLNKTHSTLAKIIKYNAMISFSLSMGLVTLLLFKYFEVPDEVYEITNTYEKEKITYDKL